VVTVPTIVGTNPVAPTNAALEDRVNEVASYLYHFTFRATNSFGAKIIDTYFIQTGNAPDYEILVLTKEDGKLLVTPNSFPGYNEIIEEFREKWNQEIIRAKEELDSLLNL
jgi:hypothetical protein